MALTCSQRIKAAKTAGCTGGFCRFIDRKSSKNAVSAYIPSLAWDLHYIWARKEIRHGNAKTHHRYPARIHDAARMHSCE
jgi:hypothetical protein